MAEHPLSAGWLRERWWPEGLPQVPDGLVEELAARLARRFASRAELLAADAREVGAALGPLTDKQLRRAAAASRVPEAVEAARAWVEARGGEAPPPAGSDVMWLVAHALRWTPDERLRDEIRGRLWAAVEATRGGGGGDEGAAGAALTALRWSGERLAGRDLSGVRVSGCDLGGADLDGVQLVGAVLRRVNVRGATMRGADLRTAMPLGDLLGRSDVLEGQSGWVRSVAFSPDGEVLASGSDDATVRLWSTETGEMVRKLSGHSQYVSSVAFSPDGKVLASGSNDRTVRLWSTETGEMVRELSGHSGFVNSVAFSPDGEVLASCSNDRTVWLWSTETGEMVRKLSGHSQSVYSVAFSPDGKVLASDSNDNTVRLWSTETGKLVRDLSGHSSYVRSVAFSPDGKVLASGSSDRTVLLWRTETGELVRELSGHSSWVRSVAFSPDGMLASGSDDKTVRLWSTETGELVRELSGHSDRVRSVAFSPDGKVLASGSDDYTVRLWSPAAAAADKDAPLFDGALLNLTDTSPVVFSALMPAGARFDVTAASLRAMVSAKPDITSLNLSGADLDFVPWGLGKFEHLDDVRGLDKGNDRLPREFAEVVREGGWKTARAYLRQGLEGTVRPQVAKLVLAGHGCTGKSSFKDVMMAPPQSKAKKIFNRVTGSRSNDNMRGLDERTAHVGVHEVVDHKTGAVLWRVLDQPGQPQFYAGNAQHFHLRNAAAAVMVGLLPARPPGEDYAEYRKAVDSKDRDVLAAYAMAYPKVISKLTEDQVAENKRQLKFWLSSLNKRAARDLPPGQRLPVVVLASFHDAADRREYSAWWKGLPKELPPLYPHLDLRGCFQMTAITLNSTGASKAISALAVAREELLARAEEVPLSLSAEADHLNALRADEEVPRVLTVDALLGEHTFLAGVKAKDAVKGALSYADRNGDCFWLRQHGLVVVDPVWFSRVLGYVVTPREMHATAAEQQGGVVPLAPVNGAPGVIEAGELRRGVGDLLRKHGGATSVGTDRTIKVLEALGVVFATRHGTALVPAYFVPALLTKNRALELGGRVPSPDGLAAGDDVRAAAFSVHLSEGSPHGPSALHRAAARLRELCFDGRPPRFRFGRLQVRVACQMLGKPEVVALLSVAGGGASEVRVEVRGFNLGARGSEDEAAAWAWVRRVLRAVGGQREARLHCVACHVQQPRHEDECPTVPFVEDEAGHAWRHEWAADCSRMAGAGRAEACAVPVDREWKRRVDARLERLETVMRRVLDDLRQLTERADLAEQQLDGVVKRLEEGLGRLEELGETNVDVSAYAGRLASAAVQQRLLAVADEHKEREENLARRRRLAADPQTGAFYTRVQLKLTELLLAYKVLGSDKVQRKRSFKMSLATAVASAVLGSVLGALVEGAADALAAWRKHAAKLADAAASGLPDFAAGKAEQKADEAGSRGTGSTVAELERVAECVAAELAWRFDAPLRDKIDDAEAARTLAECAVFRMGQWTDGEGDHGARAGLSPIDLLVRSLYRVKTRQDKWPFRNLRVKGGLTESGFYTRSGMAVAGGRKFVRAKDDESAEYGFFRVRDAAEVRSRGGMNAVAP